MSLEKRLKEKIYEAVTAVKVAEKAALDTDFWGKLDIVDEESGIEHYKQLACNLAFICELEMKG